MSEEQEVIASESEAATVTPEEMFRSKRESISTTMIKKIRALNKNQLVAKLIEVHNYAESQKAANMVLIYQVKQLNEKLNGKPHDAVTETTTSEEVENENV